MQSKHFADNSHAPCSCEWVQARMLDYLDGTLNTEDRARLQAHSDDCAACAFEIQNARRADLALHGAIRAVPAAGDLRSGFYAKLAQAEVKPRAGSRRWGWAIATPAFTVCLLAVVLTRSHKTEPERPEQPQPAENRTAFVTPPVNTAKATAEIPTDKAKPTLLLSAKSTPVVAMARTAPPQTEHLKLVQTALSIRLTPQEIKQVRKVALVRADISDNQALYRSNRRAFTLGLEDLATLSYKEAEFGREKAAFNTPMLDAKTNVNLQESISAKDGRMMQRSELGQNVNRVAFAEQQETESESYLEVDDDTRNFSYSTRLASSSDNGEEIEISVSGDDPQANSEGAETQ